jgi:hypothetical protein
MNLVRAAPTDTTKSGATEVMCEFARGSTKRPRMTPTVGFPVATTTLGFGVSGDGTAPPAAGVATTHRGVGGVHVETSIVEMSPVLVEKSTLSQSIICYLSFTMSE